MSVADIVDDDAFGIDDDASLTSPLRRYGSNAHFVADIVDDAFGMSAVDYIKFKIEFKPD